MASKHISRFLAVTASICATYLVFEATRAPRIGDIGTVAVDIDPAMSSPEPAAQIAGLLENDDLTQIDAKIDGVRAAIAQESPASRAATTADTAVADPGRTSFESRFERQDLDIALLLAVMPTGVETKRLVRCTSLNPRDVTVPPHLIEALEHLVALHLDRLQIIDKVRVQESTRLTRELAKAGGVHALDEAAQILSEKDRAAIESHARALFGRFASEGVTLEQAREAATRDRVAVLTKADTVMIHDGHTYLAPKGSIRQKLASIDEFASFRAGELLIDTLSVFTAAGALSSQEALAISERYARLSQEALQRSQPN